MPHREIPDPPFELANRVGSLAGAARPFDYYDEMGRATRDGILERLGAAWTFEGKRILDFGCGAGRTLKQFSSEATVAEFWGCDIDEASIAWIEEHMSPPFHVFVNDPDPPLAQPDESFDLIWAISVFTHLVGNWSQWLVELHRLLKPQGLLLVTFMGKGMSQVIADQEWNEDLFGMNVIRYGQSWKLGGPMVLHSPWWIEEHWGRAFEILSLEPDGFATKPWLDHGAVLMRKRETKIEARELDAIAPGDDREARALAHNIEQLLDECRELRSSLRQLEARAAELEQVRDELQGELDRAHDHAARAQGEVIALSRKATMALHEAAASRQQSLNSAQRLLKVEELVAGSKARVFALEEAVDEVTGRLERGERVLAGMKSSVSWRITAPLRALKRLR